MSSNINIGIQNESRSSSRVLKPPGGGHTDIFGPADEKRVKPRAKNNQQNSTSMGEIMGKVDSDVKNGTHEAIISENSKAAESLNHGETAKTADRVKVSEPSKPAESGGRVRVPPGGFSSGLW